jgi:hypothetical protein
VIWDTGTNDGQNQVDFGQFSIDYAAALDTARGPNNERFVVAGIPGLWIGQAQSGGVGQPTQNYGKVARYRAHQQRLAAERGIKTVHDARYDGPIVGHYFTDALGLDLRDAGSPVNPDLIHPDTLANQRRALARAHSAAGYFNSKSGSLYLPLHTIEVAFENGWEQLTDGEGAPIPNTAMISDAGDVEVYLYVAAGGAPNRVDGTWSFQLPPHLWPNQQISVNAFAGDPADQLRVIIDTEGKGYHYGAVASPYYALRPLRYNIENREPI